MSIPISAQSVGCGPVHPQRQQRSEPDGPREVDHPALAITANLAADSLDLSRLGSKASYLFSAVGQREQVYGWACQGSQIEPLLANINYAMLDDRLNLNLNVSYTGEQDDIFFPPFPAPSEVVTLDDFTLVDFAARYRLNDRIAVFGRATNLFDESYEEILGFRTLGRAVYVGARFELGR